MKREDLKVGQTVFVYDSRRNNVSFSPDTITKVGLKYFEVGRNKYHIENGQLVTEHSSNMKIYLTEQEYLDEKERQKLSYKISERFRYGTGKLTLDQLRRIDEIISESAS